MKKIFFVIAFLFLGIFSNAQIIDPVVWEFSQKEISATEVELQFTASIEEHWHLYSQFTGQYYHDEGPVPTSFVFKESDNFEIIDSTLEANPIVVFDPIFEMEAKYFEVEATFRQQIKIAHKLLSFDFFLPQSADGLLKSTNSSLYFFVFSIS